MMPLGSCYPILSPLGHAAPPSAAATYCDKVLGYSPIAYWMLAEVSGTTAADEVNSPAQDGTYARDVSAMGTGEGIGDGNTAPLFNGSNDHVNVFSAALQTAWNQDEFSIMIWAKVYNVGVWTDGQGRNSFAINVGPTTVNWMRQVSDNLLRTYLLNERRETTDYGGVTDWMHFFVTVNHTLNSHIPYIDGNSYPAVSGGTPSALSHAVIGSWYEYWNRWYGWLAHAALWDSVLEAAAIADLATV